MLSDFGQLGQRLAYFHFPNRARILRTSSSGLTLHCKVTGGVEFVKKGSAKIEGGSEPRLDVDVVFIASAQSLVGSVAGNSATRQVQFSTEWYNGVYCLTNGPGNGAKSFAGTPNANGSASRQFTEH